jgi:hypothetical protein
MGGLKEHLRVHGEKKHPQQMHSQQVQQEAQQHQIVEMELHNPLLQPQHQQLVTQHQGVQYTLEPQPGNTYTFHQQPQGSQGVLVTQDGQPIMSQGQPAVVSFPQDQMAQAQGVVIDHQGGQQTVQGQVVLIEQGNQQTRIVMQ